MFRTIISLILRSTRLFAACGVMHRRCCLLVTGMRWNWTISTSSWSPTGSTVCALYHKLQTQSSAPEDGGNHRPKHVELIEIINKLLLLQLVDCLYYCINDARSHKYQNWPNLLPVSWLAWMDREVAIDSLSQVSRNLKQGHLEYKAGVLAASVICG